MAISRTIRNARRTREILTVLIRYGFADVLHEVGVDRLIERGRRLVTRRQPDETVTHLPQAVRVRRVLEELGPTFIKMGQVLSTRPDLIPQEWADEFRRLQDDVPPVPFDRVRQRLEREFPRGMSAVLKSVEETPFAAASIAQVHRAVLADGTPVVLKILRPGIEDIIRADMDILAWLADIAEDRFRDLGYSPREVVDQFANELRREVDLAQEGRAIDRFTRTFADNNQVRFPKVYWQATTERVLAMEEIKGTLLSKVRPGDLPDETLRTAVANGTDAVFRQCLEVGFFHADPHPGNIFVLEGGAVCFIDCGMTGHLDPKTAGQLADLVNGVINGDLDRVIEVAIGLADADPTLADDRAFRADAWAFIARFQNATLDRLDMGDLLQDFFDKVRAHRLRCPSDLVFLIKAITTIEGVGEALVPDFDVVGHVRPYVERLMRRRYGIRALRRRVQESLTSYAELAEALPAQLRALFFDLRRDRFTVNLEHRGLDHLTRTIDHASGTIAHSVFVGSLIMGSSVLILADSVAGRRSVLTIIAGIAFGLAVFLIVARMVADRFR